MKRLLALIALLCIAPLSACAHGEPLLDVQVQDLDQGGLLPQIRHGGRDYIAGQPGHRFSVSLRNQTGERVLAVLSVDGVNAISGETASTSQAGYVLEPWQQVEIRGWRKSYADIAEFYFTQLPDSYAARTGRPQNVGVVGVAAFRERQRAPIAYMPPPMAGQEREATADSAAKAGGMARAESSTPYPSAQQIGTGHGQRRYDPIAQTTFERDSSRANQRVALYYDSYEALAARGVISPWRQPEGRPEPFPIGFAPDP